jgi:ribosomal protection tetracycline resistance protein
MKQFLIDGYNLLFQFPELRKQIERDLEGARHLLIQKLSLYKQRSACKITVVFDGDRRNWFEPGKPAGIKIIFSTFPEKADPLIRTLITREYNGPQNTLVTSDNEIRQYARLYSCKIMHSHEFARLIMEGATSARHPEDSVDMSREEMEEWLKLFNNNVKPGDS